MEGDEASEKSAIALKIVANELGSEIMEEETVSVSGHQPSLTHLFSANVTNNLFDEIGSSSLLVESTCNPGGLFS